MLFSEPPSEGAKLEPDCGPQQETTALANASFHPGVNYVSNTNAIQYLVFKQFSVYEKLVTLAMNLTSEQLPKKLKVDGKYLKPQRKGSLPTYILSLVGWAGPDVGPDFLGWPVSDGRTDAHPKMGFWSTQFCTSPLSQSSPALKPRPRLVLGLPLCPGRRLDVGRLEREGTHVTAFLPRPSAPGDMVSGRHPR